MTEPDASVTILAGDWPGRELPVMPGDLTRTIPQGLGLDVPIIVTPYGIGPDQGFYGLDQPSSNPIRSAPTQEACGGLLYFRDAVAPEQLRAALSVIGVRTWSNDYAVFTAASEDSVAERYLDQARIISKMALAHFFEVSEEAEALPEQPMELGDYVELFVAQQREKWNDDYAFSSKLRGKLGGDGDWAKESLAFGFFVENTYWGIYRLWSRPWLVTK